jgi:hypothetical protein
VRARAAALALREGALTPAAPACASAKKANQRRLDDKKRESSRKAERRSRDYD